MLNYVKISLYPPPLAGEVSAQPTEGARRACVVGEDLPPSPCGHFPRERGKRVRYAFVALR